jgi:hypothetical protein
VLTVQGTEGRDVIVTGVASTVQANGGDDLICLVGTGTGFSIRVDAGSGNDIVDATATAFDLTKVDLGAGADTFFGSPATDDVRASGYVTGTGAIPDNERDVIDTGDGADRIASLGTDIPNPDVIMAGPGTDHVYVVGPLASVGRIDAGDGVDELALAPVDRVTCP